MTNLWSIGRFRRATTTAWTAANPVLAVGEPGWDVTLKQGKVGDGVSAWLDLAWTIINPGAFSIPEATESVQGKVRRATNAEQVAGTDVNAFVTPATLKSLIDAAKVRSNHSGSMPASALTGLIPTASLPPLAINDVFTVASQAEMLALTAQRGDMTIRTDANLTFVLATDSPSTLADWKQVAAASQVTSVAGRSGAVVLAAADILSGTFAAARLGSGTANAAAFLRGDQTWQPLVSATGRVVLSPGGTGTRVWMRLATLNGVNATTGATLQALLSGLGSATSAGALGTLLLSVTQRGSNAVATALHGFGTSTPTLPVEIYTKQVSEFVYEVWVRFSDYNRDPVLTVLTSSGATINQDSLSTTAPSGVVAAPIADIGTTPPTHALGSHTGVLSYDGLPAGSTLTVYGTGTTVPARPTTRTDVTVIFRTEADPAANAINGIDLWLRP